MFKLVNNYKERTFFLTHISLAPFCGTLANSAKPDQTSQNAASDQGLHCLQTEISFKILYKNEKHHQQP